MLHLCLSILFSLSKSDIIKYFTIHWCYCILTNSYSHAFPQTAACLEEKGYCEAKDAIQFRQLPFHDEQFAESLEKFRIVFNRDYFEPVTVSARSNNPNEETLCSSISQPVYPNYAKNKDGTKRRVINEGNYTQRFKVERCINADSGCREISAYATKGNKFSCRQEYMYRFAVIFNDETQKPEHEQIKLPSCCKCVLLKT